MATQKKVERKKYVITAKDLLKFEGVTTDAPSGEETDFCKLQCCAFIEYSGLEAVQSVEDAIALRRIASGDIGDHEDEDGNSLAVVVKEADGDITGLGSYQRGAILVTTIPSQSSKYPFLQEAGFTRLGTFQGNGSNMVTLWAATPLRPGRIAAKTTQEVITL